MEKDSADKATTELENSVTSEEQGSSADKNDPEKAAKAKPDESEKDPVTSDAPAPDDAVQEPEQKAEIAGDAPTVDAELGDEAVAETKTEEAAAEPAAEETPEMAEPQEAVPAEKEITDKVEDSEKKEPEPAASASTPKKDKSPVDDTNVPEAELSNKSDEDDDDDDDADEFKDVDFATYTKDQLVDVVKKLGKDENPFRADKLLQKIAPVFNKIRSDEKQEALKKYIAEGGTEDDFQYRPDELDLRFDANYKLIKDKKAKKFKEKESERSKNLVLAEELLEELREFVDSDESNASFNQFKDIQQKWKDLGDVPSQNSRTLWANYNALIHRFYDQRSIYFELKELDRKKNYEAKLELCEKAEQLDKVENLREAIRTLNDLHHEFKHLGPVPKEVQEELWQRFKAASDKVYERRKAFVSDLKEELSENQEKKEVLAEKIRPYRDFTSDRIKEWNEKTKEVLAIQKEWEAIGGLPKDKAKVINKDFWGSFKKFFRNKHQFFKKLDADRDENLKKKQELLAVAVELKDSEDWDKTSEELKNVQSQWREIGPVPEKMRKKLYDEFKAACDHFFDKRREGLKSSQDTYKANLKKKKEIISQIEALIDKADDNLDKFNELREAFGEIGYVPKKNIQSIKTEFHETVEKFLNALTILNPKEKTEISLESEFSGLANSDHSQAELYQKEQSVRRQIARYEDDIALWQNNLEFFAQSKKTDKLRDEVNKKIDDAMIQLDALKRQLKMLRSL